MNLVQTASNLDMEIYGRLLIRQEWLLKSVDRDLFVGIRYVLQTNQDLTF